jgi:hypothetical protein
MTATCTSSSGEVQHILIPKTDLEQYTQHAGESSNCLNPGTEAPTKLQGRVGKCASPHGEKIAASAGEYELDGPG